LKDLYATLFYKIKFSVEVKDKNEDLLWKIVCHTKNWLVKKHNRAEEILPTKNRDWSSLKAGGMIQGKEIKIISENCYVEDPFHTSFWACKIIEPTEIKNGFAPRRWITEFGFEPISPGAATFSCIISYSDRPGFLGDYEPIPRPNIPNIIKNIWNDNTLVCYNGIDSLTSTPKELRPGDWLDFWERVKNPERKMPYIYVSPLNKPDDAEKPILVNPAQLAIATGGNALVFYAEDPGVTDEMNYFCPEDYKCYDGTIRVYYPDLNEDDPRDAKRHRFLSSSYIIKTGSDHIIDITRRAIAQDANFYDNFFRIDDCRAMREGILRKKRLDELKEKHSRELKDTENSALALAEEAEEKQLEAEDQVASLKEDLSRLQEENYRLRTENESYYLLAKENSDLKKSANNRLAIKEYPHSAQDIVRYFDSLWKVFFALATVMTDLYLHGNGDIYAEFRRKTGIEIGRGEGKMTRSNKTLMKQYSTEYHGETVNIEAHITFSTIGQSIHFGFHQKDQKIIIGWCGKHLDNYSTKKVH
jgi:Uncharacterized protein containing TOPRIM domain, potential nuclease